MRHLTRSFALGALGRGKQIEQFLGGFTRGDQHIIRWAALGPGKDGITLYLSEVIDVGSETFTDVSEFPPLDPDEETRGTIIGSAPTPEEALDLAERELRADPDRWVNQGVVGSEYADHRAARADRLNGHAVIMSLVTVPRRGREGSPEDVLGHFGTTNGHQLGLDLLLDAIQRRDGVDVEMSLIVCFTFGFTTDHLEPLLHLSSADWHCKHEDIVTALAKLRTPEAVEALVQATRWVPSYLDFDESRALATKAIHALGTTPGPEAEQALALLTGSDTEILQATARRGLERRRTL